MRNRISERDDSSVFSDLFRESKTLIKWTDQEYRQFAEQVWDERRKRPFLAMNKLYERAQARLVDQGIWGADRLRQPASIASAGRQRIEAHLKDVYREAKDARAQRVELRAELERVASAPKKEEILDKLTDEEVMVFYGQRVWRTYPTAGHTRSVLSRRTLVDGAHRPTHGLRCKPLDK